MTLTQLCSRSPAPHWENAGKKQVDQRLVTNLDLVLPAEVPIAALIPAVVDILGGQPNVDRFDEATLTGLQLSRPGQPALNASTTLAQNSIQDGYLLVLTQSATDPPAPRFDDPAEAISTVLASNARTWNRRATQLTAAVTACWLIAMIGLALVHHACYGSGKSEQAATFVVLAGGASLLSRAVAHRAGRTPLAGLTLSLLATALSAMAGFTVVPGSPGAPHILLAAAAGAAASITAMRVSGCGTVTLTAISVFGAIIGAIALVGALTEAPRQNISSLFTVLSLGLVEIAPWMSILLAGLAPRLPSETDSPHLAARRDPLINKAVRASDWIVVLVAAFSSCAAVGAISTAIAPTGDRAELSGISLTCLTGSALLLRARSTTDPHQRLILLVNGIITGSAAFVLAETSWPQHTTWLAGTATLLTAGTLYLGFSAHRISFSPLANRGAELLEYLMLAASVPLASWLCGLYQLVRELRVMLT